MKTFRIIAQESITASELMNDREKLETADVVGKKLTIEDFDTVDYTDTEGKATHYAVLTFVEAPKKFYCGGLILTKMLDRVIAEFGDVEKARQAYAEAPADDKLVVKLSEGKSKLSKNNLVTVQIL